MWIRFSMSLIPLWACQSHAYRGKSHDRGGRRLKVCQRWAQRVLRTNITNPHIKMLLPSMHACFVLLHVVSDKTANRLYWALGQNSTAEKCIFISLESCVVKNKKQQCRSVKADIGIICNQQNARQQTVKMSSGYVAHPYICLTPAVTLATSA